MEIQDIEQWENVFDEDEQLLANHKKETDAKYNRLIKRLKKKIIEATNTCFDPNADAEVCWDTFRESLVKLKQKHITTYHKMW